MRINGKVISKAEKNSNRAAQKKDDFYAYGRAILFGYFKINKRFTCGRDAIEWLRNVQSGWRAKIIYDAHLYYDEDVVKPRNKFYTYGRAILFGYFEITKRFACSQDAIEWLQNVQSGWRAKVYDAHLYYDKYAVKPMITGYDAYKFACAKKQFGIQEAIKLAQEGAF